MLLVVNSTGFWLRIPQKSPRAYFAAFLTPRELYNLVYSSIIFCQHLTVATVIEIGMFNGNSRVRSSLELLYDQTCFGKIYPPTALRTLQLINVKHCEVCCNRVVHHVRRFWGMALCCNCVHDLVTTIDVVRPPQNRYKHLELDDIVHHPRIPAHYVRDNGSAFNAIPLYEFFNHQIESCNGESVGPIITATDLSKLSSYGRQPSDIDLYIDKVRNVPSLKAYEEFNTSVRSTRYESRKVVLIRQARRLKSVRTQRQLEATHAIEMVEKVMECANLSQDARLCLEHYAVTLDQYVCVGVGFPLTFQTMFANRFIAPVLRRYLLNRLNRGIQYERLAVVLSCVCRKYQNR